MYKVFHALLTMFWICDITNMPFMKMFDTTYPINTLAWFLIWSLIPGIAVVNSNNGKDD